MALRLTISGEGVSRRSLSVGGATICVGRLADNDVAVPDPRISGRHGRFIRRGEGYFYEDVGSRNGSLVERDGERTVAQPNEPQPVGPGVRVLLGDLVSPIVIEIDDAPAAVEDPYAGATVVARRAVSEAREVLDAASDPAMLRALFSLLHDLSGRVDPGEVLARIASAVMARFEHARTITVLMRGEAGELVPEFKRTREGEGEAPPPSRTLLQRAVERREVVAYVPSEGRSAPASVAGVAGMALVPLLAGDEVIGVMHVDSRRRALGAEDVAWLTILGTHAAASLGCARRFRALARAEAGLRQENAALRGAAAMPRPLVGRSPQLAETLRQLERVARTPTTVLLQGDTGTGKEMAARFLHAHSKRAKSTFLPVNCAALPETLLESELFGHRKGAFTGATRDHRGLFEAANGGTVFLDEIGEISAKVQVRLLRVLQEREVLPVGAQGPIPVDVRVVAATNKDLRAEVEARRFREDLYYRLAVFPVRLPPLRERTGDVELLAEHFRETSCARHDKWVPGFTAEALAALRAHPWPGNVRQLEHEIERAVILADDGEPIDLASLSSALTGRKSSGPPTDKIPTGPLREVMNELEERVIRDVLAEHGSNRTRAAQALGISRQALQAKLAKWRTRDDDA